MSFVENFNYNRDNITFDVGKSAPSSLKQYIDHAYGFRKIHPDYTGYCCRIIRSSDDAQIDVKFDQYNFLSLNSEGFTTGSPAQSTGSLRNWIGSNNGNLTIVYDQGRRGQEDGAAIDLKEFTGYQPYQNGTIHSLTASDNNPIIISGGSILKSNNRIKASLTGNSIMHFEGGYESDGTPSGLHGTGGVSEVFLVGKLPPAASDDGSMTETDTVGTPSSLYKGNFLIGGHINGFVEDISIGSNTVTANDTRMYFYYERQSNGAAITGGALNSTDTLLLSAFTNPSTAGFKINNFRQTGQFDGGVEGTPLGMPSNKTPKILFLGGPGNFDPLNNAGKGEFQELIFSRQTLSDAQRLGFENYMSSYFDFFSLDASDLTTEEKRSVGFNIFSPSYGAQISFTSSNSSWRGSNYYNFVIPNGLNSIKAEMNFNFVGSSDKIRSILQRIESSTNGVITGDVAFSGTDTYINFGESKNGVEINLDTDYYKNFSGSQISNYNLKHISSDVYELNVSMFNNRVSSVLDNGEGFIQKSFPANIPELSFWVDASDPTTVLTDESVITPQGGQKVTGFIDKIYGETGTVSSTYDNIGYLVGEQNGLNILYASGGNPSAITFTNFQTNRTEFEAFALVRIKNTENQIVGFFGDARFREGGFQFSHLPDGKARLILNSEGVQSLRTTSATFIDRYALFNVSYSVSDGYTFKLNKDEEIEIGSLNGGLGSNPDNFTIFDGPQGGWGNDFVGYFAEGLVFDRRLTGEERLKMEEYFRRKWALNNISSSSSENSVFYAGISSEKFNNYIYSTGGLINASESLTNLALYTGYQNNSTRTFFWEPDQQVSVPVDHSARINQLKNSFHQQLNISKNQNRIDRLQLTFSNRGQKEAYSILHFLESHLGYKQFVYYYDDPIINQNRVFYCPEWRHTFNYKDSNTIEATFIEIVAPVTPQF